MSQYFAKGHRDRREARTARRRRTAMYGGDPYEDDLEPVVPAAPLTNDGRRVRKAENGDKTGTV
jgi:hypothetical protein